MQFCLHSVPFGNCRYLFSLKSCTFPWHGWAQVWVLTHIIHLNTSPSTRCWMKNGEGFFMGVKWCIIQSSPFVTFFLGIGLELQNYWVIRPLVFSQVYQRICTCVILPLSILHTNATCLVATEWCTIFLSTVFLSCMYLLCCSLCCYFMPGQQHFLPSCWTKGHDRS